MTRLFLLILLFSAPLTAATLPSSTSLKDFSTQKHKTFQTLIKASLYGEGKRLFEEITKKNKHDIFWSSKGKKNRYQTAFKRAYPTLKNADSKGIPDIIFLIPSFESLWQAKNGTPNSDYGYWQLVPTIVNEIKTLPTTPKKIKSATINKIRTDPLLSTEAAVIHLRRYYFFFTKVAKFSNSDACFFSIVSYNWGAGNVKRMLGFMQTEKIPLNFSNFYQVLYNTHKKLPNDKSLRAALEYLPNLWNLAQVVQK
ncbi:MAG: transglycosylase SLT domain-containing protein [Methylococcaceae bacterium]|nr:transglycosylase SLT domain-containing protein [Methylococcaceae bacterium]